MNKTDLNHHITISILQTNKTIQTRDYLIDEASDNCIKDIILSDLLIYWLIVQNWYYSEDNVLD